MHHAQASTCPRCSRKLTKTATGWRCTHWSCNRATPDARADGRKLGAALDLVKSVEGLRAVATSALGHVASEGRSGSVEHIVRSLDEGIARVEAAAEPVRDAIAAWRRPVEPAQSTEAVTLTACPRCGVFGCLSACEVTR